MSAPAEKGKSALALDLSEQEAHDVHHALSMAVDLMRQVGAIPADAPLYGAENRLLLVARRLSHERTHKGAVANPHMVGGDDDATP